MAHERALPSCYGNAPYANAEDDTVYDSRLLQGKVYHGNARRSSACHRPGWRARTAAPGHRQRRRRVLSSEMAGVEVGA